ncbi:MAG: hypothetical protein WKF88_03480 [Ferruginibacter sp.]
MKFIKYSFLLAAIVSFTSCLKSKTDAGGLMNDKGSIVSAIAEMQYINTDAQNIQAGYTNAVANFNFTKRPNESVKFFTVFVSQPRETKISGSMTLKVRMTDLLPNDPTGLLTAPLPTGAVTVTDIVIPASGAASITVPVFFNVNKTLLDPNEIYGATFKLSSSSQGVISALDDSINVTFNGSFFYANSNRSDYEANYNYSNDVVDPVNQLGIHQRTAKRVLEEVAPDALVQVDSYLGVGGSNLVAFNFITGARINIFVPEYILNASGQVTSILNASASPAVTAIALDPTGLNKFTYSANNVRTFNVKYTFTYTTTINGVVTPRTIRVSEDLSYDKDQVIF